MDFSLDDDNCFPVFKKEGHKFCSECKNQIKETYGKDVFYCLKSEGFIVDLVSGKKERDLLPCGLCRKKIKIGRAHV